MRERLARTVAIASGLLVLIGVAVFAWQQQQRMTQMSSELDPQAWSSLYPLHYRSFMRGAEGDADTVTDKLAANPFRRRAWAGNAFALEYNAPRSHYYAQTDQQQSRRTRERSQPAGCINCHAAEAPRLAEEYGWQGLHDMDYDQLRDSLHYGSSCADCHEPSTMDLRVTRRAFSESLAARGVDLEDASRQDMRSYVCAQCHVEYHFERESRQLAMPLSAGLQPGDMARYYADIDFSDWQHAETGAALIKIQHPNYELHSSGIHGNLDVACADCHMPATHEDGVRISDHWIRSPMAQLENACMDCHRGTPARLAQRVASVQQETGELLEETETALGELMDAIVTARENGAPAERLQQAREAQRQAQLRWDYIDADGSEGFHAPSQAERILSEARDIARDAMPITTPASP